MAFGAFRSIFLVVIWIYYSLADAPAGRGGGGGPAPGRDPAHPPAPGRPGQGCRPSARDRLLLEAPAGWVFCREGEPGGEMFFVLAGAVSIRQGRAGTGPGGQGHVLRGDDLPAGQARTATAVALEPCRCVVVHGKNFEALLREFPDIVREMLVEMARRLRDHTERSLEAKEAEPGPGGPDRPSG